MEEQSALRGRITSLIFPILCEIINRYFSAKVSIFLKGICPDRKMSCIGKFRRNLIDLATNSTYITCWAVYACLEGVLILMAMTTKLQIFSPQNFFCVYNILAFVFIDLFHGLVLPLKMDLSWNREHIPRPFHSPMNCKREPRRYEEGLQQKRSPENPPPSPVLVKKLLYMPRMGTEMILKRKLPTSAKEKRIIVEMPRVEVDVVTRSLRYCSNCDHKERKEILQRYFVTRLQNEFH